MTGTDRDILIARVIDGEATPEDWTAFKAVAERDPTIWRDLAEAQQDHAELTAGLSEAIAIADEIEAPITEHLTIRFNERISRVVSWGGWLAAAAVLLAWTLGLIVPQTTELGPVQTGGIAGFTPTSAQEALNAYMEKGQEEGTVLGMVPENVIVESKPADSGGYEVIYLRQIIERRHVDEFYTEGQTDFGQTVPVRTRVVTRPSDPI